MTHETADRNQLVQYEQEIGRAIAKRTTKVLDDLFLEDFIGTTPDGTVLTKGDVLAMAVSPAYDIDAFENTDIDVRLHGDLAVVVARGVVRGRYQGKDASGQFRYTRVWIQQNQRWYVVAAHSSMLPPAEPLPASAARNSD